MESWLIKKNTSADKLTSQNDSPINLFCEEEQIIDDPEVNDARDSSDVLCSSNSNIETAVKKRKIYQTVFNNKWKCSYEWLIVDPMVKQGKKCSLCNTPIGGGKTHIERHASSDMHKRSVNTAKQKIKIDSLLEKSVQVVTDEARKLEIQLSLFVAEHNLPFSILNHLNLLLKNSVTDSKIIKTMCINRIKGQQIITDLTGPENTRQICEVTNRQYFSLVIDESTDATQSKNLAIIIRIYDKKCNDMFLKLAPLVDSTASGIFTTLMQVLEVNNVPLNNLIGFTADNCNVMMGKHNGVQAKLKSLIPKLVVNGCICHNINLISMCAASRLPKDIDILLREINHHFCHSPTRKNNFVKFQEYFGTETHKILKYAATRWLSRQAAIDRVIEQWEPLQYYFELGEFESAYGNENIQFISHNLKSKITKLYFYFLSYVLEIINKINREMQSQEAKIHIFMPRMEFLFKQFCRNFIRKDALITSILNLNLNENHIPLENIYCGTQAELYYTKENLGTEIIFDFKTNVKNFYISFCEDLRNRIDFNNEVLNLLPHFSPENVTSGKITSILPVILKIFNDTELKRAEEINIEYRALADYNEIQKFKNLPIEEFWANVGLVKNQLNEPMFGNIYRIAQGILSIPHSSANVERIFSIQNLIKTKCRNRLHVNTCSSLIQSKDLIKFDCCHSYKISSNLIKTNLSNKKKHEEELLE